MPLPAELLELRANYNGETIDVMWDTWKEDGNDYYQVMKSLNGESFFPIDTVSAIGTTEGFSDYATIDDNPKVGTQYYQINTIDLDGSVHPSSVVEVTIGNLGSLAEFEISVQPNPSINDDANLMISGLENENVNIKVYNELGQVVADQQEEILNPDGEMVIIRPKYPLAGGIYFVHVFAGLKHQTVKWVIK